MKWRTLLLIATICAAITSPLCHAQTAQTNAGYIYGWNGILPSKMSRQFQSIVSMNGTQKIPGSGIATSIDSTFPLALPMTLKFLGVSYPIGWTVRVSVGGFLTFNPAAHDAVWPYRLMPDPVYYSMLFPFWSDLKTTGGADGIYHRFQVTTNNDSILTIEWRVRTMSPPFSSGAFQLHLIRKAGISMSGIYHYTMFEFDYDMSSPIDRSAPGDSLGAQIGAKNMGQDVGYPGPLSACADDSKLLLFINSPTLSSYPPAITRLPTRARYSVNYVPDWQANYTTPLSSFFHYTFPDSSCRMKPIDADAAVIKQLDPSRIGAVWPPGDRAVMYVDVVNVGLLHIDSLRVNVGVSHGGTVVYDSTFRVRNIPAGGKRSLELPLPASQPGAYRAQATAVLAGDGDPLNDVACWTYFVSRTKDAAAVAITSPVLQDELPTPRYVTGRAIPIEAKIMNSGTQRPTYVITSYRVTDATGNVQASGTDSLDGTAIDPGMERRRSLGTFTPTRPGIYYVDVISRAVPDSIPENDTLKSIPTRDWRSHGASSEARGVCPVPFEVFYPIEIGAGDPASYPHYPRANSMIAASTPVLATFVNNGGTRVTQIDGQVRITDEDGEVVYSQRSTIPAIEPGRRIVTRRFPDFSPDCAGTYTVTAWLTRAQTQADSVPGNDTTRWQFVFQIPPSDDGDKAALPASAEAVAGVTPNPASDAAVVRWSSPAGTAVIEVIDPLGRTVRSHDMEMADGPASYRIDLGGLPGGIYAVRILTADGGRRTMKLVVKR